MCKYVLTKEFANCVIRECNMKNTIVLQHYRISANTRIAMNFFISIRDWSKQICAKMCWGKNLPIVSLGSVIWRTLCLPLYCFYGIRGRYHFLFKQGFLTGTRDREKFLKVNNTAMWPNQQRTITTFFNLITPTHATNGLPTKTLQKVFNKLGNRNLSWT